MSTTVDERVVEMRFDNKHFESNVATSMSTLDKLKQKLNFSGASKGLEDINNTSKKVNMSGLGGAVDAVSAKFSALQVIGVTALANITNSAVNAGKRMISALTIDPVMSGFKEYETQINSVQTILANTSSKGTTINDVTAALDELNKYADLTIYNFTEMTRNIGTFTAAGIDLDTSVSAIQGIANLAAVSGSTSQQASVAMYQLSQALASGTVKLMDWNSVVNAGMGGEVFQNALKETSRLLGTGADAAIEASGSFRESLSDGWLTAEVLTETLKKFTESGANEYVAEYTGLSVDAVQAALDSAEARYGEAEAIEKASEALAEKSGKNKDEIKSVLQMAKTATEAATKVKTFSQLWDVMKEAAQSGWAKTWQIIIGDFEEAKALLTPLADFFTNIINKMSDWRNDLLESALGKGFASLGEKINGVLKPATKAVETVTKVTSAVTDLGDIVNRVIRGDFGNGAERVNALTEAGINYYKVQNKVNETLNNGFRYTDEQIESQDKLLGVQQETVETTETGTEATIEITDAQKDQIKTLAKLSDAELKAKGYTDEQIEAFRELRNTAEELGIPLEEFIDNLDQINGRWLLMNSFKNIGKVLLQVFKSIGEAWRGVFDPIQADQVFNVIAAIHKFTASLVPSEDTADKLTRTFKGLFAILDIITTVVGGGIKIAFKVLSQILSYFHLDILDVTASIGDALVKFHDWFESIFDISGALNSVVPIIKSVISTIQEWFSAFKETSAVQKFVKAIESVKKAFKQLRSGEINLSEFASNLGKGLANAVKSLPGIALQIGKDFIAGFANGLGDGIRDVIDDVFEFCANFVSAFASALGIHSPSVIAYEDGVNWCQGFINGVESMLQPVIDALQPIIDAVKKVFSSFWDYITDENGDIQWDKIIAGGITIESLVILKTFADAMDKFASAATSLSGVITATQGVLKKFQKVLDGVAWDFKAKAVLKMAISLGILVAAVWVLTQIDDIGKLWNAVGVIVVLAGVLVGLALALSKFSAASIEVNKQGASIKGVQSALLQIGIAILMVAAAVKLIGSMDEKEAERGFKGLAAIAIGMVVFLAAMGGISRYSKEVSGLGKMMVKLSTAMILMAIACKLIGRLSAEEIGKGIIFVGAFTIFIMALTAVAKSSGNNVSKVGGMFIKLAIAMALLVGVCKLVGMLSVSDMIKGIAFAAAFVIFVRSLVSVTKIGKKQQIAKVAGIILSISVSLLLMVGVCKLVGMLSVTELVKGIAVMAVFTLLLKMMVASLKIGTEEQMGKVAASIIAMSTALLIMAGAAVILGIVDLADLAKGVIAVSILGAIVSLMAHSLKDAQNVKGSLIALAVIIAILTASVVALSFIDITSLAASTAAISIVIGMLTLLIHSLKGLDKAKTPTASLVAIAGIILILGGVIIALSEISDPTAAIKSAVALSLLLLAMTGVLKILNAIDVDEKIVGKILALTGMAVPLLAFVGVLAVMSNVKNATENVKALVILVGAMTLLLIPLTILGAFANAGLGAAVVGGVLALTAMAVPLFVFIQVLKQMNGIEDASEKIKSLITMMTAMTLLLGVLTIIGLGGPAAIIGIGSLVALFVVIGGLAVAIGALMEKFPSIQKFLDTGLPVLEQLAGSIGTMIGKFIGGIGEGLSDSLIKIGDNISEFMGKLSEASEKASGIKGDSFDGVKELMKVMLEIGGTTVGTTIADIFTLGGTSMEKFETDGVAFFNAMKVIGDASNGVDIDTKSMKSIVSVAQSLATLQSSLEPIGGVVTWFKGRDDLGTFGENAATFVYSMIAAYAPLEGIKLNTVGMNTIIDAAQRLSTLQSSLEAIGGVITWFKGRDDLGTFGENAATFVYSMIAAYAPLEGIKLNTVGMNTIIDAAQRLSTLQSSLEAIGGVITWFKGRDDLGTFGEKVAEFINSMKTASESLEGVTFDEAALSSVIAAATKLAEFQDSLQPMGGVVSWFVGRDDLGEFGTNVGLFAEAIGKLKTGMGEDGISEAVITSITNTGTALVELQKALPEEHWFDGKMNLSDFADRINDFATAMSTFGSKAAEINPESVSMVISSAYRIKRLIESLVDLDTSGLQTFTGIGTGGFGADGAAYEIAQTIAAFGNKVANINTEAVSTAVWAAQKLKNLIASLVNLDTSGIENFKPQSIGTAMKEYADKVAGIDTGVVSSSITSANRLKNLISSLSGLDTSGISNFKIDSIGNSLKSYGISISGMNISAVSASIVAANKVKNFIASLAGLNTSGVGSFKTAIDKLSTVNISNFVKAFSGASSKLSSAGANMITGLINGIQSKLPAVKSSITSMLSAVISVIRNGVSKFEDAGGAMMTRMSGGMIGKKRTVTSAITSCLSSASTTIRNKYDSFYSAGSYLVSGFANGIEDNAYKAAAKAKAMAEAAVKAAREALKINSPSKVFKEIGSGIPEGFAMGIGMLGGTVKQSVTDMASTAIKSTKSTMTTILDALNSDMDSQPTIRPVVDLTDVKTGANAIHGMFDGVRTVGVRSNLNAINSAINTQIQNRSNDDIVSAIDKLRDGLNDTRGDTYNFGDFTYDDGSNISEAVRTLVRAAKIGRRA